MHPSDHPSFPWHTSISEPFCQGHPISVAASNARYKKHIHWHRTLTGSKALGGERRVKGRWLGESWALSCEKWIKKLTRSVRNRGLPKSRSRQAQQSASEAKLHLEAPTKQKNHSFSTELDVVSYTMLKVLLTTSTNWPESVCSLSVVAPSFLWWKLYLPVSLTLTHWLRVLICLEFSFRVVARDVSDADDHCQLDFHALAPLLQHSLRQQSLASQRWSTGRDRLSQRLLCKLKC